VGTLIKQSAVKQIHLPFVSKDKHYRRKERRHLQTRQEIKKKSELYDGERENRRPDNHSIGSIGKIKAGLDNLHFRHEK
jgi:hypothetical protein